MIVPVVIASLLKTMHVSDHEKICQDNNHSDATDDDVTFGGQENEEGKCTDSDTDVGTDTDDDSDWETCDEDSDCSGDCTEELVYELCCHRCQSVLCSRGMKVLLVADLSHQLFSTDIPSDGISGGGNHPIETCACLAERSVCCQCGAEVGYHVLRPCAECSAQDHNSHYWLFSASGVSARELGFTWAQVSYNGSPSSPLAPEATVSAPSSSRGMDSLPIAGSAGLSVPEEAGEEDQQDSCCICAASPMFRPTRISSCGHVFCFGCVSREVDARGRCPLDRGPVSRNMLTAAASS